MAFSPYPYGNQSTYRPDPLTGMPRKKKAAAPRGPGGPGFVGQVPATGGTFPGGQAPGGGAAGGGPFTIPSYTPDYKSLIEAALGPLSAQLGAEGVSDLTGRNNQMIRALGQFGQQFDLGQANQAFGPEFVGQAGLGELLPQANQLAQQTTDAGMSFTARSSKAHQDAVRQIRNALAARGALRSGELGYQLQQQQSQFDTGQYDARTQVQDFIGAIQQGYVNAQRQRQSQLDAARREEAERQARLNPATGSRTVYPGYPVQPTPPTPPTPPPTPPPDDFGGLSAPDTNWQDILVRALRRGQQYQAS